MPFGGTMSKATLEGPPSSKQWEMPPLHKVLTWSHSEAFSWDTSLVRETREEYFKRHSTNFTTENTHDLSDIFQHMVKTATLLGLAIYEIKEVWKGLDELQQANYTLKTLLKGLKFLRVVPPSKSQRLWAWQACMTQTHCATSTGWPTALGAGRRAKMRAQLSTTSGQCTIGSASCVKNVTATLLPHQIPSPTMASRTANPQGREMQWVIFICITTSRRCMRSIYPKQEPGQRTEGRLQYT